MSLDNREFFTEKKSKYVLQNEKLSKNGHELGIGFYLSKGFLNEYIFLLGDDRCFESDAAKQGFIDHAEKTLYDAPQGQIVFFNSRNPLKLELSTVVVKANPEFKGKVKSKESSGLDINLENTDSGSNLGELNFAEE
tara:strand:- start:1977 stop:2387 length:411 start_codon:yes stop_codon:yes gene_type:complete